jgi:hypothetical protein
VELLLLLGCLSMICAPVSAVLRNLVLASFEELAVVVNK